MPALAAVSLTPQQILDYLDALPRLMREARTRNGLSVKTQAPLVGVTADTLTRLDGGTSPASSTIRSCLAYLAKERP